MEAIGRIVYINLDKRIDRRDEIEGELKRMGLQGERFSAVETPVHGHGGVGCAISHAMVVRQAATDRVSSLLVLEDDFYWTVAERKTLDTMLANVIESFPDYDVIMFDYSVDKGTQLYSNVGKVIEASCASGYLVAGHYLDRLATCLEEGATLYQLYPHVTWLYINDQYWKRLQATDQWYYMIPRLGTQRDSYSDLKQCQFVNTYAD